MKRIILSFFFLFSGFFTSQLSFAAESVPFHSSFTAQQLASMTKQQIEQLPQDKKVELANIFHVSDDNMDAEELMNVLQASTFVALQRFAQGIPPLTFDFSEGPNKSTKEVKREFHKGLAKAFAKGLFVGAAEQLLTGGLNIGITNF
jgi:hypothetical protein